jgi:hypothetical protein
MSKPKTVWAVVHGEYSDYHVHCIFSTKEKAKAFLEARKNTAFAGYLEEFGFDAPARFPGSFYQYTLYYNEKDYRQEWGAGDFIENEKAEPLPESRVITFPRSDTIAFEASHRTNLEVAKKATYDMLKKWKAEQAGVVMS